MLIGGSSRLPQDIQKPDRNLIFICEKGKKNGEGGAAGIKIGNSWQIRVFQSGGARAKNFEFFPEDLS